MMSARLLRFHRNQKRTAAMLAYRGIKIDTQNLLGTKPNDMCGERELLTLVWMCVHDHV